MWSFLSKQLKFLNSNTADNKETNNRNAEATARKSPLQFEELINLMGDFTDLSTNDIAFKF
jgi:hypothetical protein